MSDRPKNLEIWYGDQQKQRMVARNWDPKFTQGQKVWVLDDVNQKILGEFEFRYYCPSSAVLLHRGDDGRAHSFRAKFLYGHRLLPSKESANIALYMLKSLEIEKTKRILRTLESECSAIIDELSGKTKVNEGEPE